MSDSDCFVFGLVLDGEGGARQIDQPEQDTNLQWIHVDYSVGDVNGLLTGMGLPERVVESLVRLDTRPRCIVSSQGTLLVVRGINMNPGADPEDMVSLRIWISRDRLVTVRQRRLLSVQDVKDELIEGEGPRDLIGVVIEIIGKIAGRIADYVSSVDEHLESLEEKAMKTLNSRSRSELSEIRREVASVRRYLSPQRDALESLFAQSRNSLDEHQVYQLREELDRQIRYLEDLELIRERCQVLQEEMANRIAEQQNNRMYALSIVAAIFLPISFVTGLFGMNVAGLPGLEDPSAFAWVAGSMIVIVGGIMGFFRWNRWL